MTKIILIVLITELFGATGQILFKRASNSLHAPHLKDLQSYAGFLGEILAKPQIWIGLFLMTIGLVAWLAAISQADLSLVYPLGSIYYILVLFMARIFLGEKLDRIRLLGTLLIMVGIAVISAS